VALTSKTWMFKRTRIPPLPVKMDSNLLAKNQQARPLSLNVRSIWQSMKAMYSSPRITGIYISLYI